MYDPEWAKTLSSRLSRNRYDGRVRALGWKRLMEDSRTIENRLAIEAIISNALDARAMFHQEADQWLGEHLDNPLVRAALFHWANLSPDAFQRVVNWVMVHDRFFLFQVPVAPLLPMLASQSVNWSELCDRFEVGRYNPHPKQSELELWQACRWVQASPQASDLPGWVRQTLDFSGVTVVNSEDLQQAIVETLLDQGPDIRRLILTVFEPSLLNLWQGILRVLGEDTPRNDSSKLELAKMVEGHLGQLSEQACRELLAKYTPYVWSIGESVLKRLGWPDDTSELLLAWDNAASFISDERKIVPEAFQRASNIAAKLSIGVVGKYWRMREAIEPFRGHPDHCQANYQDLVAAGRTSLGQTITYLEIVGESGQEEFVSWLANTPPSVTTYCTEEQIKDLLQRFVLPWGLPAGKLMRSSFSQWLYEQGYQLQPVDFHSRADIVPIPPDIWGSGEDLHYSWTPWESSQWRRAIFAKPIINLDHVSLAMSLILTMAVRPDEDWVKEAWREASKEEWFRRSVLRFMIIKEHPRAKVYGRISEMILVLLGEEHWPRPFDTAAMEVLAAELVSNGLRRPWQYPADRLLGCLLLPDEQIELGFRILNRKGEVFPYESPLTDDPKPWIEWFSSLGLERARLANWLVQKHHELPMPKPSFSSALDRRKEEGGLNRWKGWFRWAKELKGEPGLAHTVMTFLDFFDSDIVGMALEFQFLEMIPRPQTQKIV